MIVSAYGRIAHVGRVLETSDTITATSDQEGKKMNPTLACSINLVSSKEDEGELLLNHPPQPLLAARRVVLPEPRPSQPLLMQR